MSIFIRIWVWVVLRRLFCLDSGFYIFEPGNNWNGRVLVMIHGLGRSAFSMIFAGKYFFKRGWKVVLYDYRSTCYSITKHAEDFRQKLEEIVSKEKDKRVSFDFFTHSLGGIVLWVALKDKSEDLNIGRVVMLATPNRGSELASWWCEHFPFLSKLWRPLCEIRRVKKGYVLGLAEPDFEHGIVVGLRDNKVKSEEARTGTMKDYVEVDSCHTFIMNNAVLLKFSENFFQNGLFKLG